MEYVEFTSDSPLMKLKSEHKSQEKGNYFDEGYFYDLVVNQYLPQLKENKVSKKLENEVLAQIKLIVDAVINKYGIWRFEDKEILMSEGVAECWRALPTFDTTKGKKWFHFLSLVSKYHLINLTKKEKISRETADIEIQPDLQSEDYNIDPFRLENFENELFDIIDENFKEEDKHSRYTDYASILIEYIKENQAFIGKNDLLSFFRQYGVKSSDFKKFISDIEPYRSTLYACLES